MANVSKIKLPDNSTLDIIDSRISSVDSSISSSSSGVVTNSTIAAEFDKVAYIGDTIDSATYTDGGIVIDVSNKADKVTNATSGNFAALDANGNLTDSGHKSSDYQTTLISGTNIKTINNESLLGSGNITIGGGGSGTVTSVGMTVPTGLSVSGSPITSNGTLAVSLASGYEIPQSNAIVHKAGTEIITGNKTFCGTQTFDDAYVQITGGTLIRNPDNTDFSWLQAEDGSGSYKTLQSELNNKQDALVSGTNIKTVNNQSLLGSGNISISGGGGDTSTCVHKTGDETVGGDKTFTDDIIVGDASNIKYGASSGEGFTKGYAIASGGQATLQFSIQEEPKAFVITLSSGTAYGSGVGAIIGDSTGCRGIYAAESTSQHNYSTAFTSSYSNGTLTITPPSGARFVEEDYAIVYYYGSGTLTFRTNSIQPGSGITSVTFTGTGLTETPAMYACLLETQVNSESYRRVALYTNSTWWSGNYTSIAHTFYSQQVIDSTSSFTASYNNGLVINSGGTNAGGYFHNPGTYTLYYLTSADIGGGSGSYNSLKDELDGIRNTISGIETLLAAI